MERHLTGIGRYARSLTYALQSADQTLEIWLLNPYPRSPLSWYDDFFVCPLPALRRLPAVLTLGPLLLTQAARRLGLDILHDPCGIAPFLAPRLGVKRVVTVHDAIPLVMPKTHRLATRMVFRTNIPAARWTADAILTCSESARRDLIRHARLPVGLVKRIYPGCEYSTAMPSNSRPAEDKACLDRLGVQTPYLLYVGTLNARKNLIRVLSAFEEVLKRHPHVQLVVVGPSTWDTSESKRVASRLNGAVRLTGFVSDHDLHQLYSGAVALVYPSLYEGFGFPILEAMSRGTPVITSNTSSMVEVAGGAALLVNPFSVEGLAGAMQQMIEDPSLRTKLAKQGRSRAGNFGWNMTAIKTLEVYRQLLSVG